MGIFHTKCKTFKQEEEIIKKGLLLFKEDLNIIIENNKDLLEVEEQINALYKIWEIKKHMNEVVHDWCHTQFYDFDLNQMIEIRNQIENDLIFKCKDLKNKPIYTHMKEQLELFANIFVVLQLLRDPAMNGTSHWDKIQTLIGDSKLDPNAFDFNFERILELKLEQYKEPIEQQVEYAREQQKVNEGIERIAKEWDNNDLKFELKEDSFKLLSNEKMCTDLEEHLTKIAEYKSTPYYEDFKEKIDKLEAELNKISDIYLLLKQVLDKWNYLKNVFSKDIDDIAQQIGIETANFEENNKKFWQILIFFKETKIVKKCFQDEKLDNRLKSLYSVFSGVERGLYNLLETKRNSFERFYFLSNDDFLELLGNSEDPKIINFHLSKLFSGIDKVKIDVVQVPGEYKGEHGKRKVIKIVLDSLGEELKLENDFYVSSVIETWLKELEKQMIDTLEKGFSGFYNKKNFEFKPDKKENLDIQLASLNINGQMLLTLTQYFWKNTLQLEYDAISRNELVEVGYDNILTNLNNTITKVVEYMDSWKEKISVKNRLILYNYILILKNLTDNTLVLKSKKVRSSDNYDWQKLLKMNLIVKPTEKTRKKNLEQSYIVVAEQLNNISNYGYEYLGNKERLVITGLTEKCFLTMMTAIFYHRGGSLQGPAGTGKTETIKDLSRNLGKYVIVFNCSNKNNYNTMATLFKGLLKTGAWCCFDEFNRIEIEVLSVIRIQLTIIYDGLRSHAKSIPFKGTYVEVNKELAIFITMNPSYIFRSELPDNLKTLFRPIAVVAADKLRI